MLFLRGLPCAGGVPFRPADLTSRHSSPPPEVPREMALDSKTSRQLPLRAHQENSALCANLAKALFARLYAKLLIPRLGT